MTLWPFMWMLSAADSGSSSCCCAIFERWTQYNCNINIFITAVLYIHLLRISYIIRFIHCSGTRKIGTNSVIIPNLMYIKSAICAPTAAVGILYYAAQCAYNCIFVCINHARVMVKWTFLLNRILNHFTSGSKSGARGAIQISRAIPGITRVIATAVLLSTICRAAPRRLQCGKILFAII